MGSLFKPKIPPLPPAPEPPPAPKPVRLPFEQDPEVAAAGKRTRAAATRRRGRLSTILTDRSSGSSGQKLGA
jgi:hypothetical protein